MAIDNQIKNITIDKFIGGVANKLLENNKEGVQLEWAPKAKMDAGVIATIHGRRFFIPIEKIWHIELVS